MMEELASGGSQEFDVYGAMDWKDGVGTLPGSELKFQVNEFGVLEVITDEAEVESVKKAHATTTWAVPTAQEETQATPVKEEETTTAKLCCEHCLQCGPPQDFLGGGKFCSEKCMKLVLEISREQKLKKEEPKSNEEDVSKYIRKRKNKASDNIKEQQKENGDEAGEEEDGPYEKPDRKMQKGPQRARRKRRGDAALLKQRVKEDEFNWQSYLKLCKAQAAPKSLFENRNTTVTPSGFRIGMKFEAIDRKNPSFICVATVTDMVDSRFLVHFDNWDESYDYW
ncbi:UNVERIFIED_CONTAM: hypothetical protein FKN15_055745 [Acipenser sinensis]